MIKSKFNKYMSYIFIIALTILPEALFAQAVGIAGIAQNITKSLSDIAILIVSISILAGLGFGVASAFKFKQHKDNPTQVPLGQPLTLLAIGVMLLWLPYIMQQAGATLTGGKDKANVKIGVLPSFIGDQKSGGGGSGGGN